MYHTHISARRRLLDLQLKEVWRYRDLILLFTRRTFSVSYKQTILGPLWLFINPLLTALIYVVLFGRIAELSTDGAPQLLFYLAGTALWSFFSACVSRSAATFTANAPLFEKVYFPRLVVPISNMLCAAIQFGIQFLLVCTAAAYYTMQGAITPHFALWPLLPVLLAVVGVMGMGVGVLISALTTKYRDLSVLVGFGLQLWMYATPVVYPASALPDGLSSILRWNPAAAPMELFRHIVLGTGTAEWGQMLLCTVFAAVLAILSAAVFNRVERSFIDTV